MQFDLEVDYAVLDADRKARNPDGSLTASAKNATLTIFLITRAFEAKHPPTPEQSARGQSLGSIKAKTDRKIVGRIHNALTLAQNGLSPVAYPAQRLEPVFVELEKTDLEYVLEVLDDWAVPQQWSGWRLTLLEAVEEQLREAKAGRNHTPKAHKTTAAPALVPSKE